MFDTDKYCKGTVVENRHWTDNLFSLFIEVEIAPFVAGQFGRLGLEINGESISRPYSFVNAPDDPIKEFYAITVPQGPLSPELAIRKPGDVVWVGVRANGFLRLDEVPQGKHLWLVSTGTGLGPFLSILRTKTPWERFEKIILIHAVRTAKEATYREDIQGFADSYPEQFVSVHFVSREEVSWALSGRIPSAIESGTLEEKAACRFHSYDSQVMICGNPSMVKDVTEVLKVRGLKRNRRKTPGNISVEAYW